MGLEAEQRTGRCRGHAMLPGTRFRDDPPFAHAVGEQRLPERVVDLVRAGVRQVFPLQEDSGPAGCLGEAPRFVHRGRPPDVIAQQSFELRPEPVIVACREVRAFELFDRLDQRLGHIAPAELAEVSACVGIASESHCLLVST